MNYEIDIEGLGPEWEPVRFGIPYSEESFLNDYGEVVCMPNATHLRRRLIVRRKVRKYDWSKTLDDVLIRIKNRPGLFLKEGFAEPEILQIGTSWQPNIHGKCPVDREASWVRVRLANGIEIEDVANKITWEIRIGYDDVVRWQFIRLADGYEW